MTKKPINLKNLSEKINKVTTLENSTRLEKLKKLQFDKIKKERKIVNEEFKKPEDKSIEDWFKIKKIKRTYPIFRIQDKHGIVENSDRWKNLVNYIETLGGLDTLISKSIHKRQTQKDIENLKLTFWHVLKGATIAEEDGLLTPLDHTLYTIMNFEFPFMSRNKIKDTIRILTDVKLIVYIHGNKKRTYYDGVKKSKRGESLFSTAGSCSKIYLRDTQVQFGKVIGVFSRDKNDETKKHYTLSREKHQLKIGGEKGRNYAKVRIKQHKDLPKIEKPSSSRYQKRMVEKNDRNERYGFSYNGQNIVHIKIFNNDEKSNGRDYATYQNLGEKARRSFMYPHMIEIDRKASQPNFAYYLYTHKTYSEYIDREDACPYNDIILNLIPNLTYESPLLKFLRGAAKKSLLTIFHCQNESGHLKVVARELGNMGICYNGRFRRFEKLYNIPRFKIEEFINKSVDKSSKIITFDKECFKRHILAYLSFILKVDITNKKTKKEIVKIIDEVKKSFHVCKKYYKNKELDYSTFYIKFLTAKEVVNATKEVHSVLNPFFYNRSVGAYLTLAESETMSLTEKHLDEKYNTGCLSIHDAIFVHKSKEQITKELLEFNFRLVCDRLRINFLNRFIIRKAKINTILTYIFHIINNEWDTPFFIDIKALLLRMFEWLVLLGGKGNYVAIH